jgi:arginyl-tRNA synthetase
MSTDIFLEIKQEIKKIIIKNYQEISDNDFEQVAVEMPKNKNFGDLSTNAPMVLCKKLKQSPLILANDIISKINSSTKLSEYIESSNVAGGGFINFKIKKSKWFSLLDEILKLGINFGYKNLATKEKNKERQKINVEYVSCNPTGPMHIGHVRCAVFGDVIARILSIAGYNVTKEFYINDFGNQISNLGKSVYLRYLEITKNDSPNLNQDSQTSYEGLYKGEYIIDTAEKLRQKFGDFLQPSDINKIIEFSIQEMMQLIIEDLKKIDIQHDLFFSEKTLHQNHEIEDAIEILNAKGLVYKGILPPPKGEEIEDYETKEQLLFKSTNFGDDQDRVIQKSDGSYPYFSADIAYARNKIKRGYNELIVILGADHIGYIKRFEAIIEAISDGSVSSKIKTCSLVNYIKDGEQLKMSKRAGNFTTAEQVINEVGSDAIRYMMVSAKANSPIDFDLDLVKEQNKDNPIFYIQYAIVRINSAIRNAKEKFLDATLKFENQNYDLNLLSLDEELEIIKMMSMWPKVFESSVTSLDPHKITNYIHEFASLFHSIWNLTKEGTPYRIIVENNENLTAARLALIQAIKNVLSSGLNCIGIKPLEKM